jgi:hypothetical protein
VVILDFVFRFIKTGYDIKTNHIGITS